ncbi:MAG: hypothetical protein IKK85_00280 [Clostridia bacterium]|nr:hypothetical protein [Clostridia bacterium]
MRKIKLYHISYDTSEPLDKEFVPKIPKNCATGENESIERICLSDSIEGCINAAEDNLRNYEDADKAIIVVWEKEFSFPDDKLMCWPYLYENNFVPDAALTHEYWYLEKVRMQGSFYEISNINHAISNKKLVYIIKPKYKEKVLQVISKHGIDTKSITKLDLYTLVNDWLPIISKDKFDIIIEDLKREIRIPYNTDEEILDYKNIFDTLLSRNSIIDIDSQKIYHHLTITKKYAK